MQTIICSQCGQRPGMTDLRCQKCGSPKFKQVDTRSLIPRINPKAVRAGQEATYRYLLRTSGKVVADRWWRLKDKPQVSKFNIK